MIDDTSRGYNQSEKGSCRPEIRPACKPAERACPWPIRMMMWGEAETADVRMSELMQRYFVNVRNALQQIKTSFSAGVESRVVKVKLKITQVIKIGKGT